MLPRILEPEVMESEQDAREYNQMDHSEVNRTFVLDLLQAVQQLNEPDTTRFPPSLLESEEADAAWFAGPLATNPGIYQDTIVLGDMLDVGTGTALIPIELFQFPVQGRVLAIDLAASMLNLAKYNLNAAGLTAAITLAQVDAKQLDYSKQMFDLVFSNSIVHHIPRPIDTIREMDRVLRPGGIMFVRDLLRPGSESELNHLVETYAGTATDYSRRLFADSLHAALTVAEMQDLVQQLGYEPESVQATSDRHWTWAARKTER